MHVEHVHMFCALLHFVWPFTPCIPSCRYYQQFPIDKATGESNLTQLYIQVSSTGDRPQ